MKTLTTILAIALMVTGLRAQSQCEAYFTSTQNETTAAFVGSYFVNGQQITEPAMVSYEWNINNTILTGEAITYNFQQEGLYTVCLTASGLGCTSTFCDSIFIGTWEPGCDLSLSYDIINATDENTADGSIDITVTGGTAPYSFAWDGGQVTEDISGLYPGIYTVVISDSDICSLTWSFYVMGYNNDSTVTDTVFNGLYAGAYYYFESEEDCTATVYAEVYGGTAPYTYLWNNGVTTTEFTNACGDEFYCVTIVDAEGESAEACVFVQYYDYGQDTVWTVNDTLDIVVNDCLGNVVNAEIVDYIIQGNTVVVSWEFTDEFNEIVYMTVTYTLQENANEGLYQIYLYINCGDLKSLTAYSDQIIVTANDLTGITDILSKVSGQLYPNPVVDELNIELNSEKSDNITLEIYNYSGQLVYQENNKINSGSNIIKLDASNFAEGMYFVKISGNSAYETMRFVK
jgi:hypothetical protein